jgi:hypothetical protein
MLVISFLLDSLKLTYTPVHSVLYTVHYLLISMIVTCASYHMLPPMYDYMTPTGLPGHSSLWFPGAATVQGAAGQETAQWQGLLRGTVSCMI